ncbi:MAG: hypothetical protein ACKO96_21210 [Flammeovirgaceae bacterium]
MKKISILIFVLASYCTFAQVQKEIDQQVWKPFIETFNNYRSKQFLSLHSKDVVRSPRSAKQVWNWEAYLQQTIEGDEQDVREKRKRYLELRFTERINNATHAIEVGVYKTTYQFANGETQMVYGRFHVVLRKEKGNWKILVDTDSSEGGTIGEKEFLEAVPLP